MSNYHRSLEAFKAALDVDPKSPEASKAIDAILDECKVLASGDFNALWVVGMMRYLLSKLRFKLDPNIVANFDWYTSGIGQRVYDLQTNGLVEFAFALPELASRNLSPQELDRHLLLLKLSYNGGLA